MIFSSDERAADASRWTPNEQFDGFTDMAPHEEVISRLSVLRQ
jgi:hypothetical protein